MEISSNRIVRDRTTKLTTLCNQLVDLLLWLGLQIVVAAYGYTTWDAKSRSARTMTEKGKRKPTNKGPRDRTTTSLFL